MVFPRCIIAIIVFLPLAGNFFAQGNTSKKQAFHSVDIEIPATLDESARDFSAHPFELKEGKMVRYIQLASSVDAFSFQNIYDQGITLHSAIGNDVFLASLPADMDEETLNQLGIKSYFYLTSAHKIITTANPGKQVVLKYINTYEKALVLKLLSKNGIEIIEDIPGFSAVILEVSDLQIAKLTKLSWVEYIEQQPLKQKVEFETGNLSVRANLLASPLIEGISGNGVHIALGDDGWVSEHVDLQNRIIHFPDVNTDTDGQHGDLVAGIIVGAGNLNPKVISPAPKATLHVLNEFDAVKQATSLLENDDVVVTCTALSDGCNRGYSSLASLVDQQLWENPTLMHVFSAGNAGQDDCNFGAGIGWGTITGGLKLAKNAITVANIDLEGKRVITSSKGPTTDGRLKPDLSVLGLDIISTLPDNSYGEISGSSASAPLVTGVWAQLVEAYRNLFGDATPPSALLKAALLNTADDLGTPGPDYSYGWGRVHGLKAWKLIEQNRYWLNTLDHGTMDTLSLTVPDNISQLKVMLYWHDWEGNPLSQKVLVNNLDLLMTDSEGTLFRPLVLSNAPVSSMLSKVATAGVDSVNNVEQIVLHSPEPGEYKIFIKGQSVPFGPQAYVVNYEFNTEMLELTYPAGGEKLIPGDSISIFWDASKNEMPVYIDFATSSASDWMTIGVDSQQNHLFKWKIPDLETSDAFFRVRRSGFVAQNERPVTIFDQPQNLKVERVCADFLTLRWDSIPGATGYVLYKMGAFQMDSFTQVSNVEAEIPIESPENNYWFAVSALFEGGKEGPRSLAISNETGLQNCVLSVDLGIEEVSSPSTSVISNCFTQPIPVGVQIRNNGLFLEQGYHLYYQLDKGMTYSSFQAGSIPPGVTVNMLFDSLLVISEPGYHSLKVWLSYLGDEAAYNDTLEFDLEVIEAMEFGLPYFQTFDDFTTCPEDNSCAAICELESGWTNDRNGVGDQIDWRTNKGPTKTSSTGPVHDQNTQSNKGTYLYLESSQGCYGQSAHLISPCINLGGGQNPRLSFWYHMFGADMGKLHIDLFDGEQWYPNIVVAFSGQQSQFWEKAEADLTAFAGKTITIRFRGITGNGFLSDMAIDNIAIYDAFDAPIGGVIVDDFSTCPGQSFSISDNSFNSPTTWEWKINPPNVIFVDGTTASSENPTLQFQEPGSYEVSLVVSNDYGDYVVVVDDHIQVTEGQTLPHLMDFESPDLNQAGWDILNEDNGITWNAIELYGKDSEPTTTYFVNNHNYLDQGQEDILVSPVMDLTEAENPLLRFDLAYTYYDFEFSDRFQIKVSINCGESFDHIIFDKSGAELATVDNTPISWGPNDEEYWRSEVIDLSGFTGYSIVVQFVNINGFGNNLYLDNILFHERDDFPTANFTWSPARDTICYPRKVSFSHASNGSEILEWEWFFGQEASPSVAYQKGPHEVAFLEPGLFEVSLKTSNELGYEKQSRSLVVSEVPQVQFSYEIENNRVQFTNYSEWGSSFFWDFGDGHFSNEKNPAHQYNRSGVYSVTLRVSNTCGETVKEMPISVLFDQPFEEGVDISMVPNPTSDKITVRILTPVYDEEYLIRLFDAKGKKLYEHLFNDQYINLPFIISMESFPEGIYFLKLFSDQSVTVKKLIKLD